MKIILDAHNRIHSYYSDEKIITIPNNCALIIIPNEIFELLSSLYDQAGYSIENGVRNLPDPRTGSILTAEQLQQVKVATAQYNRQVREEQGVTWNGHQFKTDTKTCSSLLGTIQSVQAGTLSEPIGWRCADGEFVDLTLIQLQEVAGVVLAATEANFAAERAEIAA
jgi:hypothetical protein